MTLEERAAQLRKQIVFHGGTVGSSGITVLFNLSATNVTTR